MATALSNYADRNSIYLSAEIAGLFNMPRGSVGQRKSLNPLDQIKTYLNSNPQAAQVSTATVTASPDLAAKLQALDTALHSLKGQLGVPDATIPPSFWETRAGMALSITLSVVTASSAAAATGYGLYQTFHK